MDTKDTNELEHITPRQLRALLFFLDNHLTVSEIRERLFDIPDQNKTYQTGLSMWVRMNKDAGYYPQD